MIFYEQTYIVDQFWYEWHDKIDLKKYCSWKCKKLSLLKWWCICHFHFIILFHLSFCSFAWLICSNLLFFLCLRFPFAFLVLDFLFDAFAALFCQFFQRFVSSIFHQLFFPHFIVKMKCKPFLNTSAFAFGVVALPYLFPFDFIYLFLRMYHSYIRVYVRCFHFNLMTFVSLSVYIFFSSSFHSQPETYCLIQFGTHTDREIDVQKVKPFLQFCFSLCVCVFFFIFILIQPLLFIHSFILLLKQPYKLKLICLARANSLRVIG